MTTTPVLVGADRVVVTLSTRRSSSSPAAPHRLTVQTDTRISSIGDSGRAVMSVTTNKATQRAATRRRASAVMREVIRSAPV
jgi:hypothetical protein